MRRELMTLRHVAAILGAAVILWIGQQAGLLAAGAIPSLERSLEGWRAAGFESTPLLDGVWALLFAIAISALQELPFFRRMNRGKAAIVIALTLALILVVARGVYLDRSLLSLIVSLSVWRAITIALASLIIDLGKRGAHTSRINLSTS